MAEVVSDQEIIIGDVADDVVTDDDEGDNDENDDAYLDEDVRTEQAEALPDDFPVTDAD
jgi:hypothetical protein